MFRMNKSIYLAAFAALALTACSNDQDEIFDQSAADRLEQYKKDYAEALTDEGGLWSMEYFSNDEEEGYVFVMKFNDNGSVDVSANHKWIGGTFKQETSLWRMIADNGPVLSFNSYNTLFHIFSDPANITGPDAPTGEEGDIDETGFGHEGDYEFQVMGISDDGKTMRLLGKKWMHNIYLHRLDPSTDVEKYLSDVKASTDYFTPYVDYFNLVDANGEPFIVTGLNTGIVSVYPKNGDFVSQTRTGNIIFTTEGIRFMSPLEVPRADESEDPLVIETFKYQPDGSLLSDEGVKIVGPYATDMFLRESFDFTWIVDLDKATGEFAQMIDNFVAEVKKEYPSRNIESIYFGYDVNDGVTTPALNLKLSGTRAATFYITYTSTSHEGVTFRVDGMNSQALTFEKKTKAFSDFAEQMSKFTYVFSSPDIMRPVRLVVKDKNNDNNTMEVEIK